MSWVGSFVHFPPCLCTVEQWLVVVSYLASTCIVWPCMAFAQPLAAPPSEPAWYAAAEADIGALVAGAFAFGGPPAWAGGRRATPARSPTPRARRLAQRGRARRPQRADRACRIVTGAHAAGDARRPNAAQRGRARRARRLRRGARVPPARGRTAQRRIGRPVERRARLGGATSGAAAALHSGDHSL